MNLTPVEFVLSVVMGCFALVPLLVLVSRILNQRVEKRSLANRVICRLCLHAFEDTSHANTVDCPACRATNEKGRGRRLG